jgi:hypothetical protein
MNSTTPDSQNGRISSNPSGSFVQNEPGVSLYHRCVNILEQLMDLHEFQVYLSVAAQAVGESIANASLPKPKREESWSFLPVPVPMSYAGATIATSIAPGVTKGDLTDIIRADPVSLVWTMLRLGEPLAYLYNLAVPDKRINLASSKATGMDLMSAPTMNQVFSSLPTLNAMKAHVYHFLVGLRAHLTFFNITDPDRDIFSIAELYQDDTSGFVKVLRTFQILLSRLESMEIIPPVTNSDANFPGESTVRRRSDSFGKHIASGANGITYGSASHENHNRMVPRTHSLNTVTTGLDVECKNGSLISPTAPKTSHGQYLASLSVRQRVLLELLHTERKYVEDLERLQSYMKFLTSNEILPFAVVSSIFSNLNGLVDFQRRFLVGVEAILDGAQVGKERLGNLFVSMEESFASMYELFCANYKSAADTVIEYSTTLQAASHVMEPNYELPSFLIKPIQRICRYPLLLGEVIKKSKSDTEKLALSDLQAGLEAIKRVADRVNEARRKHENSLIKEDLERRVEDWKGHDISSFGLLLFHDKFSMLIQDYERELVIFLFEKIILCCKEVIRDNRPLGSMTPLLKRRAKSASSISGLANSGGASSNASETTSLVGTSIGKHENLTYQIKGRIWIGGITDLKGGDSEGLWTLTVSWNSLTKVEYFTLKCRNEEQFRQWMTSIQRCVDETRGRGRGSRSNSSPLSLQQVSTPQFSSSLSSFPITPVTTSFPASIFAAQPNPEVENRFPGASQVGQYGERTSESAMPSGPDNKNNFKEFYHSTPSYRLNGDFLGSNEIPELVSQIGGLALQPSNQAPIKISPPPKKGTRAKSENNPSHTFDGDGTISNFPSQYNDGSIPRSPIAHGDQNSLAQSYAGGMESSRRMPSIPKMPPALLAKPAAPPPGMALPPIPNSISIGYGSLETSSHPQRALPAPPPPQINHHTPHSSGIHERRSSLGWDATSDTPSHLISPQPTILNKHTSRGVPPPHSSSPSVPLPDPPTLERISRVISDYDPVLDTHTASRTDPADGKLSSLNSDIPNSFGMPNEYQTHGVRTESAPPTESHVALQSNHLRRPSVHQSEVQSNDQSRFSSSIGVVKCQLVCQHSSGSTSQHLLLLPRATSYSTLVSQVRRKMGNSRSVNLRIQYEDDDGDRVLLCGDDDVSLAMDLAWGNSLNFNERQENATPSASLSLYVSEV